MKINPRKGIKISRGPRRISRMSANPNSQNTLELLLQSLREKNRNNVPLYTAMSPLPTIQIYNSLIKDTLETVTVLDQQATEDNCLSIFSSESITTTLQTLQRESHIKFLRSNLGKLPSAFVSLDASRPWITYWCLNALSLLGDDISDLKVAANNTILECVSPQGGISGNVGQLGHLAPTYAGINTLAITGNEEVWAKIDRKLMYKWLLSLKLPNGGFKMHVGGECDTRAVYCALSIASLLNILTPELIDGVGGFIKRCQTFEGGFSGFPDVEAHGGYAFCSLASLCIMYPLKDIKKYINIPRFTKWLSSRQHQPEGGFSGRTNKLVDGCYNHWVGGCWALLENILDADDLWSRSALQNYTLYCCQIPGRGGLRDKPGKQPDAYHTNYTLCGLSGAQHQYTFEKEQARDANAKLGDYAFYWTSKPSKLIEVKKGNEVLAINPVHVLPVGIAEKMNKFFRTIEA